MMLAQITLLDSLQRKRTLVAFSELLYVFGLEMHSRSTLTDKLLIRRLKVGFAVDHPTESPRSSLATGFASRV